MFEGEGRHYLFTKSGHVTSSVDSLDRIVINYHFLTLACHKVGYQQGLH